MPLPITDQPPFAKGYAMPSTAQPGNAPQNSMSTGAVTVTFNTAPATLTNCLSSLSNSGLQHMVVVDNQTSSHLSIVAGQYQATYLPQNKNRGFAAGVNIGAKHLTDKYLLFINPDAALEPGARVQAEHYLDQHPTVGIIGLLMRGPDSNQPEKSFGAIVTPLSILTRHFKPFHLPSQPHEVGWVSGGALMIRREVFLALNGFDTQFFLYWEDVDLCRRARDLGAHVVVLPQARATHQRGASLADNKRKTNIYDESADKYFCKHYSKSICLFQHWTRRLYRLFSPQVV